MSTTVIIECISWLINVTDNNDAWWIPEITFNAVAPVTNVLNSLQNKI
jgi:hypothetical protein